jgi:hypothetical protein
MKMQRRLRYQPTKIREEEDKEMRIRMRRLAAIVGFIGLGLALPAFGQSDGSGFTVNFTTPNNPVIFGDGYADPYNGTVTYNNGPSINPNGLIVCDDYNDNINENTHWPATGIQASTLANGTNLSDTMFGTKGTMIGLLGYAEVANLVSQMFSTTNNQQQGDLSAAIWWITSGGKVSSGGVYSLNGVTLNANASALLSAVLQLASTNPTALLTALANDTNLWILTPSGYGTNGQQPQEMWISTPEGGATLLYLLLAGLTCFGAMRFSYLNQTGRRGAA